jgi:hypothetical protein
LPEEPLPEEPLPEEPLPEELAPGIGGFVSGKVNVWKV